MRFTVCWDKNGSIKKYSRPKEAQTGLKLDKPEKIMQKRILKYICTVVSDCLRFLLIILGRNGSGNDHFWLKTDRLKKYFRPKEAQTGLKLDNPKKMSQKRFFFLLFWPKRID
jgi:hypothetical protein